MRFAADQEFVGQDVPGTDQDPAGLNLAREALAVVRADLQVVLEDDGLAVQMEGDVVSVFRTVALEDAEELVHGAHEAHPEVLEGEIPLAVPMRVRDDVQGVRRDALVLPDRHGGHGLRVQKGRRGVRRVSGAGQVRKGVDGV